MKTYVSIDLDFFNNMDDPAETLINIVSRLVGYHDIPRLSITGNHIPSSVGMQFRKGDTVYHFDEHDDAGTGSVEDIGTWAALAHRRGARVVWLAPPDAYSCPNGIGHCFSRVDVEADGRIPWATGANPVDAVAFFTSPGYTKHPIVFPLFDFLASHDAKINRKRAGNWTVDEIRRISAFGS